MADMHFVENELFRIELLDFFTNASRTEHFRFIDKFSENLCLSPDPEALKPSNSSHIPLVQPYVSCGDEDDSESDTEDSEYYRMKHCASPSSNIRWLTPEEIPKLYLELGKLRETYRIWFITNGSLRGVDLEIATSGNICKDGRRFQSASVQIFKELPDNPDEAVRSVFNLPRQMTWEGIFFKEPGRISFYDAVPNSFFGYLFHDVNEK